MKRNVELMKRIRDDLRKSSNNLALKRATRIWIQKDLRIHALNYWYYRWFTNQFELFLIGSQIHGSRKVKG